MRCNDDVKGAIINEPTHQTTGKGFIVGIVLYYFPSLDEFDGLPWPNGAYICVDWIENQISGGNYMVNYGWSPYPPPRHS